MIFFESRPIPVKGKNGIGLQVATRMGCKVFIAPSQTLSQIGVLADMELQNALQPRVRISVKNSGDTTFRAGGTLQIIDEAGTIVAQGALKSAQVVPQAERNLWFSLPAPLPAGRYNIKTVVDYGVKQLLGGELKTKVIASPTVPVPAVVSAPAKGE
jgi:P pilus assembly chaperone PapD